MGIVTSDKLFLCKGEYGMIECRLFTFLERMIKDEDSQNYSGQEQVDKEGFLFCSQNHSPNGHEMELIGGRFEADEKHSFPHCIINLWNSILQEMVMTVNPDYFKRSLYKFMKVMSINGH